MFAGMCFLHRLVQRLSLTSTGACAIVVYYIIHNKACHPSGIFTFFVYEQFSSQDRPLSQFYFDSSTHTPTSSLPSFRAGSSAGSTFYILIHTSVVSTHFLFAEAAVQCTRSGDPPGEDFAFNNFLNILGIGTDVCTVLGFVCN
jgi:hypothetical protein